MENVLVDVIRIKRLINLSFRPVFVNLKETNLWKTLKCPQHMQWTWWQNVATPHTGLRILKAMTHIPLMIISHAHFSQIVLGWISMTPCQHINGLMQERRSSIANTLELRLSCTNLSIYSGNGKVPLGKGHDLSYCWSISMLLYGITMGNELNQNKIV